MARPTLRALLWHMDHSLFIPCIPRTPPTISERTAPGRIDYFGERCAAWGWNRTTKTASRGPLSQWKGAAASPFERDLIGSQFFSLFFSLHRQWEQFLWWIIHTERSCLIFWKWYGRKIEFACKKHGACKSEMSAAENVHCEYNDDASFYIGVFIVRNEWVPLWSIIWHLNFCNATRKFFSQTQHALKNAPIIGD